MKPNNKKSVRRILWTRHSKPIANRMILIAIGLSAFFWLLDAVLDSLAFGFPGDFISQLFTPSPHEVWIRLIVAGILITFAIYAQFTVTRRKQAEESLKESEGKFETFSENVPGVVCIYDLYPDGHRETVYVGPGLEQLLGRSTADRIGNSIEEFFKLIYPDDLAKLHNAADEARETGQVLDHDYRVRIDSENYIWVRSVNQASRRENGIVRWSGQVLNVTEHKEAEEALKQNEERYRELFNSMSSGVAVYRTEDKGKDFTFKDFNRAGERIEKVKREDVIGKTISEVFPEVDGFTLLDVFQRVWKTGKPEGQIPSAVYKDQKIVGWRENYVYRLPTGEIVSIFDDVTERRQAQESLRESEELHRNLFEGSLIGIYRTTPDGRILMANPALVRMLGYSSFEDLTNRDLEKEGFEPTYPRSQFKELMEAEGEVTGLETAWAKTDGSLVFVRENAKAIPGEEGAILYYEGTVEDITEHKRAEEDLRKSEERLRLVLEGAELGTWDHNMKTGEVLRDHRWADMLGYTPEEIDSQVDAWKDLVHPDDLPIVNRIAEDHEAGRTPLYRCEHRMRTKSGQWKWILNCGKIIQWDDDGKPIRATGTHADITERKKAEDRIREQNEFLNTVIESLAHPFMVIDANDYTVRLANCAAGAGNLSEGNTCYSLSHKRKRPCGGTEHCCPLQEVKKTKKPVTVEHIHYDLDGNARNVEVHGYPVFDEDGNVVQMIEYYLDVTERKRAEEALRTSEEKYRGIYDESVAAIYVFDAKKNFVDSNQAGLDLLGYSRDELLRMSIPDVDADPVVVLPAHEQLLSGERLVNYEHQLKKKDGTIITVLNNSRPLTDVDGNAVGMQSTLIDITERKRAEEKLRESEEKYRTLVETAQEGIGITDPDENLTFVNQAFADLLGYTKEELLALNLSQICDEEEFAKLRKESKKRQRGQSSRYEARLYAKTGEVKYFNVSATPLVEEKGTVTASLAFLNDITERKRAEEDLKNALHEWRVTFDSAKDLIMMLDAGFKVSRANLATARFLDRPIKEIAGKTCYQLLHGTDRPPEGCPLEKMRKTKKHEEREFYLSEKDIWILASVDPILDDKGNVTGAVHIIRDITERKRAEETLRDSESKYRTLVRNIPQKIFIKNKDSVYVSCNENYAKDLKIKPDEIAGKTDYDFYPEALAEKYRGDDKRITESRTTEDIEEPYIQDGQKLWVHTVKTPVKDENGNVIGVLGIFWDITERKKAEEALSLQSEIAANMSEGVYLIRASDGVIVYTNPKFEEIFGYGPDEMLGKHVSIVNAPTEKSPEETAKEISEFINKHGFWRGEINNIKKDGTPFWCYSSVSMFDHPEHGRVWVVVHTDITERKKMEAQLMQSERLTAVGTLAYGIAHEFNNILAGILGNVEYGMGSGDSKEVEGCFRVIMENCDRAGSITNSLLTLARQRQVKKEVADLTDAAENVLGLVERELEKQNIRVERKFKPVPEIVCDLGELSEVFLNMITNARDAMKPDGGSLTIEVRKRNHNIEIIFADTGGGIPDEIKGRIFEPFVTTKGALGQSEIPGTGLGLFLSYGIISRYQGEIEVQSEEGQGSTFTIKIPVAENQQLPDRAEAEDEGPTVLPPNLNILLVDDEEAICSVVKKFLEEKGYSVVDTTSGKEGLKLFKDETFDLVLSDITMPDMDGVKLISKLKNMNPDIRIVTLTGHVAEEKLEAARKAGADQILLKPFRKEYLYRAIGRALSV